MQQSLFRQACPICAGVSDLVDRFHVCHGNKKHAPGKGRELIRAAWVKPHDTSEGPVIDDVPERKDGRHLNRHPRPKPDR